jgi:hypothetical protein
VNEIDEPVGTVDQRHPGFATHFSGCGLAVYVPDAGAFKAIPNAFASGGPLVQALDTVCDEPKFSGNIRVVMDRRVNVEGNDVRAFDIFRVVFRMARSHTTAVPAIPGNALAEI